MSKTKQQLIDKYNRARAKDSKRYWYDELMKSEQKDIDDRAKN